ncbi:hypothetical protein CLV73_0089 [Chryseobacterium geocarposphaerae]|uniref:Uncharacterized protein n=1 Tax=Chryseobacterium geocarposphaerae TaxID=1416776 RepID=A0A2M9C5M5_9FLAO|nr:hypothetical protein CLV73_0089 [Chryseobacterium geocarposphaerae]
MKTKVFSAEISNDFYFYYALKTQTELIYL